MIGSTSLEVLDYLKQGHTGHILTVTGCSRCNGLINRMTWTVTKKDQRVWQLKAAVCLTWRFRYIRLKVRIGETLFAQNSTGGPYCTESPLDVGCSRVATGDRETA